MMVMMFFLNLRRDDRRPLHAFQRPAAFELVPRRERVLKRLRRHALDRGLRVGPEPKAAEEVPAPLHSVRTYYYYYY